MALFKTTLLFFYLVYIIHTIVDLKYNRYFPFVYVLMTGISKETYKCLFEDLADLAAESDI